jgi:hypothetical protein
MCSTLISSIISELWLEGITIGDRPVMWFLVFLCVSLDTMICIILSKRGKCVAVVSMGG